MLALIEKIITLLVAVITWLGNVLVKKYPLWLYIVVFLASVLFVSVVACSRSQNVLHVYCTHFDYDAHQYIAVWNDNQCIDIMHDPDCICYVINN